MKKLTTKQVKIVCELINLAVLHLGDTDNKDNKYNSVHFSIGYYGHMIKSLTALIKNGYDDHFGTFDFDDKIERYKEELEDAGGEKTSGTSNRLHI